jgi:hypothetical protein
VTLFSWRISTKKSRVLFNIQWNSGDWTLEGTRREPEGKTRRENPKGKPEGLQKYHHVYHHTILFRVMAVMFF